MSLWALYKKEWFGRFWNLAVETPADKLPNYMTHPKNECLREPIPVPEDLRHLPIQGYIAFYLDFDNSGVGYYNVDNEQDCNATVGLGFKTSLKAETHEKELDEVCDKVFSHACMDATLHSMWKGIYPRIKRSKEVLYILFQNYPHHQHKMCIVLQDKVVMMEGFIDDTSYDWSIPDNEEEFIQARITAKIFKRNLGKTQKQEFIHRTFHTSGDWVVKKQPHRALITAFFMGFHPRLGSDSLVRFLPEMLVQDMIAPQVMRLPRTITGTDVKSFMNDFIF